jgi:hypothetical protein
MGRYAKFFSLGGGGGTNNLQLPVGTILDATLRQVQDGLGTGSPLYLSTGGLRVGTTAGSAMYWDNTNSRLGIGTSAPSAPLQVIGITDIARFGTLTNYWRFNTNYGADQSLEMVNQGGGGTNTYYNTKLLNETYQTKLLIGEYQNYLSFGKYDNHRMVSLFNNGNFVIGSSTDLNAKLGVRGSGSTSATTSLLVQNSAGTENLKITDDSTFYFKGASGTSLRIKSAIEANSSVIQFNNDGLGGGYSGGYTFTTGFNSSYGSNVTLRIYPGKVGIGNITEGTMQNNAMNLYVDNTQTGGRNKAIKLNVNFANISTEYNGIQFDTIENGSGGAFVGSQYNTSASAYGSDLAIFTTVESPANTYTETARFVGKSQSLSIGAGKNPTARLQVQGSGSTSATTSLLVQNSSGTETFFVNDDGSAFLGSGTISYGPSSGPGIGLRIALRTGWGTNYPISIGNLNSLLYGTVVGSFNTGTNTTGATIFGESNIVNNDGSIAIFGSGNTSSTYYGGHLLLGFGNNSSAFSNNGQNCSILIGSSNNTNGFYGSGLIGSSLKYYDYGQLAFGGNSGNVDFATKEVYFGNGVRNENYNPIADDGHGPTVSINVSQSYVTNNRNGGNLILRGGQGTGSGTPGSLLFSTGTTGVSGTTFHTYSERMRINGNGNVLIGTTTDIPSSKLTITSTTQGFLPPRVTTIQKNAISSPANGLMVYDTDLVRPCFFNGATWITL